MTHLSALMLACVALSASAIAQDEPPKTAENAALPDEITPQLDAAATKGLAWLARQQLADGSFGDGRLGPNVAVTSLACLAFMADGHLPGRGEYGEVVRKGLEFVVSKSGESGLVADDGAHGPMYGHGFATLFLGEVYGMSGAESDQEISRLHEVLTKAVRLIETTQNEEGGWRYNPIPFDADVSVTICQVMGLRSARNAGIEVEKAVIDKAVDYVKRCQNPDGGFRYQQQFGSSGWARSAAGVATLYYAGEYENPAVTRGLDYLNSEGLPGVRRNAVTTRPHYFYGHYYAVQVMYLAGEDKWAKWWPAIRDELIANQEIDGNWSDPSFGSVYGTSMALIVLQMPKRYLPIFQR